MGKVKKIEFKQNSIDITISGNHKSVNNSVVKFTQRNEYLLRDILKDKYHLKLQGISSRFSMCILASWNFPEVD